MLKRKRRIEITRFTEHALIVRQTSLQTWCDECAALVNTVTLEAAAALAHTQRQTINEWVDDGRLHCLDTSEGRLVCLNSLTKSFAGTASATQE
jgi:hypothetical protein